MSTPPDAGDGPPTPDGDGAPAETLAGRAKRWSRASSNWAIGASERHLSVALSLRAAERNRRVAASVLAGGFAYRLFFWLLALGLVGGGALGFLDESSTKDALGRWGIPGAVVDNVGDFARDSNTARWWMLGLGVYLMLWSGYTGSKAASLVHALIWDVPPARLAKPFQASVAFSGVLLALFGIVLATWWLYDAVGYGALVAVVVLILPLAAFWTLVSLRLPHGDADWKALLPGAFLMATGLQLLHVVTLWLVAPKLDKSESLYGPLGAVATLLFWMYLAGRLVVTAPILNAALHEERKRKSGDLSVPPPVVASRPAGQEAAAERAADGEAPEGGTRA